jgi:hypothetical protein
MIVNRIYTLFFLFGLTFNAFAQIPNHMPTNGLVGWWPFTGNANDLSGNGHNGSVNGATLTADRFGVANSAFSFDGVNDFINCGPFVLYYPQEFTIDLWLKFDNATLSNIFSQATNGEIQIRLDGNGNVDSWNKLTNFGDVSIGSLIPDFTNWHRVTVVFNNNTKVLQFIIDGQVTSTTIPNNANIQSWNGPALFGRQSDISTRFFKGKMDDVAIWDRALTNCEIQTLYQGTLPLFTATPQSTTTFCIGDSVILTASQGQNYVWSNGQTAQSITASNSGAYSVQITDTNGCVGTSTPIQVLVLPSPQVVISSLGPTSFCEGGSTILNASGATSYQWNTNQIGNSIVVSTSGNFFVIGTDANGCVDTSNSIAVFENANPIVTISSSGPTTFCQGGSVTLIGSGVPNTYIWSNGTPLQFINVNSSGNYFVIGTDANGCVDTSTAISVVVNPLPVILSSNSGPTCVGNGLTLSASGGISFSWSGPNGFSSISPTIQLNNTTLLMNGQYTIISTDSNGCIGNSATSVLVYPNPSIFVGNTPPVCQGQTIMLTSSGGTTYQWTGPNGFTSISQNPSIPNSNLSMSGQYQAVAFNSFGCSDTALTNVVVNPLPQITSTGGGSVCSKTNVAFTSNGGQTYLWSGPNGYISSQQNPILNNVNPSMGGNYIVSGTDANGCSSNSTLFLNVISPPSILSQPQNLTVGLAGGGNFSVLSSDTNAIFQWQTDLGLGFQNLTNGGQYLGVNTNTLAVANVGWNNNNQQFRCIISSNTCSDTSDVGFLFVDESLSSQVQSLDSFSVYPNPSQTDFTIRVPESSIGAWYELTDNSGRVVLRGKIISPQHKIFVEDISRGTYFIRVENLFQKRIVVH